MKRLGAVIILVSMLLAFASACGTAEPNNGVSDAETTSETTSETTAETTTDTEVTDSEEVTSEQKKEDATESDVPSETFTSEQVDEAIQMGISSAIANSIILPTEGFSENVPMPAPSSVSQYPQTADACCTFGQNGEEVFVVYLLNRMGGRSFHEISYANTGNYGFCWDRIGFAGCENAVDIFAIDRKHFIVLWDMYNMGYGISLYEDGVSPTYFGDSSKYYKISEYKPLDLSFLFPRDEFDGVAGSTDGDDLAFFESVSAFYCERIDEGSCRIVLEYEKDGVVQTRTAIYDINGIRAE